MEKSLAIFLMIISFLATILAYKVAGFVEDGIPRGIILSLSLVLGSITLTSLIYLIKD